MPPAYFPRRPKPQEGRLAEEACLLSAGRTFGKSQQQKRADAKRRNDFYILTLAAIAKELALRKLTSAAIHIAAGLPLTWVSEQKDSFRSYLLQNESADFTFRDHDYHVDFAGADIFPQGFSAVADRLREFRGVNMLCDIGNGTMNVMVINDCRPLSKKCFTEKYGTNQCLLAVRENLMRQFGVTVDDSLINRVIRTGTADIGERYLTAIRDTASETCCAICEYVTTGSTDYFRFTRRSTSPRTTRPTAPIRASSDR